MPVNMSINTNMKKILIICTPRVGSSNFQRYLSSTHNVPNLGEVPGRQQIFNNQISYEESLYMLKSADSWVVKLIPTLFNQYSRHHNISIETICDDLISYADSHIFLYRKDFRKQLISMASATTHGNFFSNRQLTKKVQLSSFALSYSRDYILEGYTYIKEIYKKYPSELVKTEDLSKFGIEPYDQTGMDYNYTPYFNFNFDVEKNIFNLG